jgi:tetratricopeptide (TPR) repeat protein
VGIDYIVQGNYKGAQIYADTAFSSDKAAQHFLKLSALYARMGELETEEGKSEFFQEAEWLITQCRNQIAQKPSDSALRFYEAYTYAYRAVIHSKAGNFWSALKDAAAGKREFEMCTVLTPELKDVYLGIGVYMYWMSAINIFRVLPFIADNRLKGIQAIESNLDSTSLSYPLSLNQLCWILIDCNDLTRAEYYAYKGLALYPRSRFFLYPAAVSAQKQGKWQNAAALYEQLRVSLLRDSLSNRYFFIKVTVKYAETLTASGEYKKAYGLVVAIDKNPVIATEQEKCKELYKKAKTIEKQCRNYIKNESFTMRLDSGKKVH